MKFNCSLILDEQPAPDINQAQSNTLKTYSIGGGMVYLNVSGSVLGGVNGRDGGICTIMTTAECLALVKLLQAACEAAESPSAAAPVSNVEGLRTGGVVHEAA